MVSNETNELSERELEILRSVATGASNKEIAQTLYISSNTVKVHLRNIFNKIGVSSRTEAAMYAVRIGLVQTSTVKIINEDESPALEGMSQLLKSDRQPASTITTWLQKWGIVLSLLMVLVALSLVIVITQLPAIRDNGIEPSAVFIQPTATAVQRWQEHPALPTARSALALAAFENRIYAIGGETSQGVTGVVQSYDPATEQWTTLKTKPTAVTEISAVVLGGKIYIPGGRLGDGTMSNVFEAYDPGKDTWYSFASIPASVSGYALIAYEGRIYLFGGWNGESYVNTVYAYDPNLDEWQIQTPMPTARGLCGAAVSSGQINVIGGIDGTEPLTVNEIYIPSRDNGVDDPWHNGPALPEGRYAMGVASASDLIYIIGGRGKNTAELPLLVLSPTASDWQPLSSSIPATWSYLSTVPFGQYLYVIGGLVEGNPTSLNLSYQAIYTVVIPFVR